MSRFGKQFVLAAVATVATLPALLATTAQAAPSCQCTTYVANRFNLTRNFPNAGDWDNGYLARNGFVRVAPQRGAIAVMERNFPGADAKSGHVGVVESITNGRMALRGANQWVGSDFSKDSNCSNVRVTNFGTPVTDGRVSFWMKR